MAENGEGSVAAEEVAETVEEGRLREEDAGEGAAWAGAGGEGFGVGKTRGLTAAGREDAPACWEFGSIDDPALRSDTVLCTSTGIGGVGAGGRTRFDTCSGAGTAALALD